MALIDIKFNSATLWKAVSVTVIMPDGDRSTPVRNLYLLHGLSDDNTMWLRRSSIERYAARYNVAVIMPDGDTSFYTDMVHGRAYYTFMTEELPTVMKNLFGISDKREDNFIAGLSMGGYGALKIALRNPERFTAAAGLSPATDMRGDRNRELMKTIFGESGEPKDEDDLFKIAETFPKTAEKPRLYITIGGDDFLLEENRRFKSLMEKTDFDFTYIEREGAHTWEFWDENIVNVMDWMFK